MATALRADLFRHNDRQAVSLPAGIELPGNEVTVRRDGPRLVLEPVAVRPRTLAELFASWEPLEEGIGAVDDPPPDPIEP